jgi:hypothetical protein
MVAMSSEPTRSRRLLLGVVLASIAVNAALGIYALLVPHFGALQGKVLGTSACVTGAGILAFACLPAWEQRRLGIVPPAAATSSALGFALVVTGIWTRTESAPFWKATGTALVVAGVAVLSSVLALARLVPRYRWVFPAAAALAGLLGAVIVGGLWGEPSSDWYPRLLGIVAVLLAAVTLALPILHRASRGELAIVVAAPTGGTHFCPSCGRPVPTARDAAASCEHCGARFEVRYLGESDLPA